MVIGIFGESCVGKSSIADALRQKSGATVYTGKDYIKLAKQEDTAKRQFMDMLEAHEETAQIMVYVITEKEHLALLPSKAIRVLVTAELDLIKQRFARRMNGKLPDPVAAMLEKKHGAFDNEAFDLHLDSAAGDASLFCDKILALCPGGQQQL